MAEIVKKPKPVSATVKDVAQRFVRHENVVLFFVLIAMIGGMGGIAKGLLFRAENVRNVLLESSMRGVASIGQAFVILTAGIDLSVGGVGLMCAIIGASLMTPVVFLNIAGHPLPFLMVIPIVLLIGMGCGAINGAAVSRISMPPLIVTLSMWLITTGIGWILCRGAFLRVEAPQVALIGLGRVAGVPVSAIIYMVVAATAYFVAEYTPFGKSVYAVGGNPVSAWLSGVNVRNIRLMVFIISGFLAGLTAVVSIALSRASSMLTLSGLELDTIAAVCIGGVSLAGGKGSIIGTVIGVLMIGFINNFLNILHAKQGVFGIVKGAVIFTAVAVDYIRRR